MTEYEGKIKSNIGLLVLSFIPFGNLVGLGKMGKQAKIKYLRILSWTIAIAWVLMLFTWEFFCSVVSIVGICLASVLIWANLRNYNQRLDILYNVKRKLIDVENVTDDIGQIDLLPEYAKYEKAAKGLYGNKGIAILNLIYLSEKGELIEKNNNVENGNEDVVINEIVQPVDAVKSETILTDPVDINTCTKEQLALLPGIGQIKAKKAIEYRDNMGSFADLEVFFEQMSVTEPVRKRLESKITCNVPTVSTGRKGRIIDL